MPPQCKAGLIVPALQTSTFNAVLYLGALLYCFLGTAIIADIFMCAIERITSTTRKVRKQKVAEQLKLVESGEANVVKKHEEDDEYEYVQVWNPTIANLSLMALGSSAPEILLSLIEIIGNDFKAGELGPGTIVGSAAFNLFCISAICVVSVRSPYVKRIQQFSVFLVTAAFSLFAYLWILVILVWSSPNVVEVWEAALTLGFFVVLIIVAYVFDVQLWKRKGKMTEANVLSIMVDDGTADAGDQCATRSSRASTFTGELPVPDVQTVRDMTREVSRVYPSLTPEDHAKILAYRINQSTAPHDRLYYRIKAIREMTASWRESKTEQEVKTIMRNMETHSVDGRKKPRIEFSARTYGVHPGDKTVKLTIVRHGTSAYPITVNYSTVNGVAKKDLHFLVKHESLRFQENEASKDITIQLVEGADWKAGNVFYVHLKIQEQEDDDRTKLGECSVARIRPVEDSGSLTGHPSAEFTRQNIIVSENQRWVRAYIIAKGKNPNKHLSVKYETEDVSAQAGFDYVAVKKNSVLFKDNEMEKCVEVEIIDDKTDEKDETFLITICEIDDMEVNISTKRRTTVTIISDDNALKNVTNVRKLMGNYLRSMKLERATWKEQIVNTTSVNGGDIANATVCDAVKHGICFPWKFIFAFVPPAEFFGGWPCFFVALALIGFVTAIVGDVASIFGCMVGLPDAVTAITLVALGTSLPDTFASKIAAEQDKTADNAVGNVTGSNSVNVFLGLGLPWLVASIYWASKGEQFVVEAGDLSYSVAIFTCLSVMCLMVLLMRRWSPLFGRGELGGPRLWKYVTFALFIAYWIVYLGVSINRSVYESQSKKN